MTPEARAARERKQKIFVVVGGLFLLAMLAFQLPKLLGGSSAPAAAPATTATTGAQPAADDQPVTAGATPVAAVQDDTTKLTSFSVFTAKDPFVQQVVTASGATGAGDAATKPASGEQPKGGTAAQKFSTGKSAAAAVTIVTVNGTRQVLQPGQRFPASDPLFVLVSEKPSSKSVVVGIAGGAYSGGKSTTSLKVGKPLTLVNTATGARYKLTLVSVGSGDASEVAPKPKP
jgi:hypothetical protein